MNSPLRDARRKTARTGALLGLAFAGLMLVFIACSNYGEGERCQSANGDNDCETGLICTPAAQLENHASDRCCPSDRSKATATICKVAVSVGGSSDAAAGPETGLPTENDGSTPTESDAGDAGDAQSDAGRDADAG